ncbi:MAG: hypothetical protein QM802_14165 [Agriterribacter sp.]
MLKTLQHKRFNNTMLNDALSLMWYCYVQTVTTNAPVGIGSDDESIKQRPDSIRM